MNNQNILLYVVVNNDKSSTAFWRYRIRRVKTKVDKNYERVTLINTS